MLYVTACLVADGARDCAIRLCRSAMPTCRTIKRPSPIFVNSHHLHTSFLQLFITLRQVAHHSSSNSASSAQTDLHPKPRDRRPASTQPRAAELRQPSPWSHDDPSSFPPADSCCFSDTAASPRPAHQLCARGARGVPVWASQPKKLRVPAAARPEDGSVSKSVSCLRLRPCAAWRSGAVTANTRRP